MGRKGAQMKLAILAALAFVSISAFGQTAVGQWQYEVNDATSVTWTANESGSQFGIMCQTGKGACEFFLNPGVGCEGGAKYPVLISTKVGAAHHTLTCVKARQSSLYTVDDFNAMDSETSGGGVIGIAFPMQDGSFKVSRFSLDGMLPALKGMLARGKALGETRLGDTRL